MINVAIIGTGGIAKAHLEGFLAFPERCHVLALIDPYPEKAQKLAQSFHLDVAVYEDFHKILEDPQIHLVSICTPPYTHAEIAVACLNHGKHVICEKPMASSLEECDAINAAFQRNEGVLSIIAQNRFFTPVMKLKQTLESGMAGKVLHTQVNSFWWRGHSYYDLWWRGTWEKEGGGCTLNHAVHHIDMLQWMIGMPSEVRAVMSNTAHDNSEVEDLSIAILKYSNGSLAQVTSSLVHHGEEQQITIQGEKASLGYPWKVHTSVAKENGFGLPNPDLEKAIEQTYHELPSLEQEGHTGQIDNVLAAIEQGKKPLIGGDSGRNTLELIMAIYKSASLDTTVQLPLPEEDPFYTASGVQEHAIHFYEKKRSVENFQDNEITVGSSNLAT